MGAQVKMSKSKKNVIDPQDIIDTYGADAARLFILSDSPPERDIEWTTAGIEGAWKYVNKLYKSIQDIVNANVLAPIAVEKPESFGESATTLRKIAHRAADNIGKDIENFHMNRAVARLREFSNAFSSIHAVKSGDTGLDWALREALEYFVIMINPMMPHLAEELWEALGHNTPLTQISWPKAEKHLLADDTVTLAVQVNGKMRATITLPASADKDTAEKTALAEGSVQSALAGLTVKKIIVVPGRVVNVVAA
jgi:leucyl-tRNA synthetase